MFVRLLELGCAYGEYILYPHTNLVDPYVYSLRQYRVFFFPLYQSLCDICSKKRLRSLIELSQARFLGASLFHLTHPGNIYLI